MAAGPCVTYPVATAIARIVRRRRLLSSRRVDCLEHLVRVGKRLSEKDHAPSRREHDPEKWKPVFRKDHAPPRMTPQSLQSEAIALGNGGSAMSIAPILQRYLDQNVTYEV